MCNFSCCFLCLLPLPVCCAPSRRIWLHLLCNSLSVSGRLQFGPRGFCYWALSLFSHMCTPAPWPSCWVFAGFTALSVFLLHWGARDWHSIADTVSKALVQRGRIACHDLLWALQLMQLRMLLLVCFIARVRCWLLFGLLSTRTSRAFSSKTCLQPVWIHLGLLPGNMSLRMSCIHSLVFWASSGYLSLASPKWNNLLLCIFMLDILWFFGFGL